MEVLLKIFNLLRGYSLLDIRLRFHFIAFVHLAVLSVVTLAIDPSIDEDPSIKQYGRIRWKLITLWFNLLTLLYLPICLYCEWQQKKGRGNRKHVRVLLQNADMLMTGILVPTTILSDILFWSLMNIDVSLIAPPKLFVYLPSWCQHSLHSISFVVMILDLMLTPRRKPNNLLPRFAIGTVFFVSYVLVVYGSFRNGELIYSFLELLTTFQHIILILTNYIAFTTFSVVQWKFINYLWDGYSDVEKLKSKSI